MSKIPVGVLGATGVVGQNYIIRLAEHPWFEIAFLASSSRSSGRPYAEAVGERWRHSGAIPDAIAGMHVHAIEDLATAQKQCRLVFSAVGSAIAGMWESQYAKAGLAVVSNASAHRGDPDVPVIIPEVNAEHLRVIASQRKQRGWDRGLLVAKPNCSLQSYLLPLAPLHAAYGLKSLFVTTLQALSGAGHPGVAALDIGDNVIPFINGEEEKSEREPLKILGVAGESGITPTEDIAIAVHCNRVPVSDGHLACVSATFQRKPESLDDVRSLWDSFPGLELPSAPKRPIAYLDQVDRPQPRLDRDTGNGMTVSVGRLRSCPLGHLRFTALSHNAIRGAAGGGVLIAEQLHAQGFLD